MHAGGQGFDSLILHQAPRKLNNVYQHKAQSEIIERYQNSLRKGYIYDYHRENQEKPRNSSKEKEHKVDALVPGAEEGRDKLR